MLDSTGIRLCGDCIDTEHIDKETGDRLMPEVDLRSLEPPLLSQLDIPIRLLGDIPFGGKIFHRSADTRFGDTEVVGHIGGPHLLMDFAELQDSL